MKKKRIYVILWLVTCVFTVMAQNKVIDVTKKLNLDYCIELGFANNPSIAQTAVQYDINKLNLKQSLDNRLPTINSTVSQYFSLGRTLDPFTNEYRQENGYYNNYDLGATITIFNGLQLNNAIKQNRLNLQAAQVEVNTLKFTQSVQITNAFLLVLNNEELLQLAQIQLKMSVSQLNRVENLFKIGSVTLASLNELKIQVANDDFAVKNAQYNILTAKSGLLQAMNIHAKDPEQISLSNEDFTNSITILEARTDYATLIAQYPSILLNKTKIKAQEFSINVAKGALFPILTLSAGMRTSYSSLAPTQFPLFDAQNPIVQNIPSGDFINIGGDSYDVFRKIQIPNGFRKFDYVGQLDYNLNKYISVNLMIPIFDRFTAKNRIKNVKLQKKSAEGQLNVMEEQLLREIESLVLQKNIAKSKFEAVAAQLKVVEETYKFSENRFNLGAINYIDFNLIKTNYEKNKISLIQAKYDYVLKEKIYQLYKNGVK